MTVLRHLALPDWSPAAERRLAGARVLVVGVGGLGAPVATSLATAGVGHLTLVDPDNVAASNLHRQHLYTRSDVGRAKVEAARCALEARSDAVVDTVRGVLHAGNAADLVPGHDLVVDGTDDLESRYALNDACCDAGVPWVHGSVFQYEGRVAAFHPDGPCYRCLHPVPAPDAPDCVEGGVLGPVPGWVAAVQATVALRLLAGLPPGLGPGRLLLWDATTTTLEEVRFPRRQGCPGCGSMDRADRRPLPVVDPTAFDPEGVVLDVRDPTDRGQVPLPGAYVLPWPLPDPLPELPSDPVVVCRRGRRSAAVVRILQDRGVHARSLAGGLDAWQALRGLDAW